MRQDYGEVLAVSLQNTRLTDTMHFLRLAEDLGNVADINGLRML
jgi:hypothetical protein